MDPEEIYQSWRQRRADAEVPAGFSDKVMRAVETFQRDQQRGLLAQWFLTLAASRLGRAGILGMALVLFAVRLLSVIGVFLSFGSLRLE